MARHILITGFLGLLLVGLAGGCSSNTSKTISAGGGSTKSRAEQNRKQAEAVALNVVNSVAAIQVQSVPDLKRSLAITAAASPPANSAPPAGMPVLSTAPLAASAAAMNNASAKMAAMNNAPAQMTATNNVPAQMTAMREPPPGKASLRPSSKVVIHERVSSSIPYALESDADEDALIMARDLVERKLAQLDPPVHYRPTVHEVRTEFVRKDSRTVREQSESERNIFLHNDLDVSQTLVYIDYDVDVTADQIRELHSRERVILVVRLVMGVCCVALAGYLFLRADDWTKGYLTHWLAGAAVVFGGAAVAVLYFA